MAKLSQPWTLWITGLSGSGKTTISKELIKILDGNSIDYEYIRLDEIRQFLTPDPQFTRQERELVYRCAIYSAEILGSHGVNSIIDSVDGQGFGRNLGREKLRDFHVVWIDCPIEVCIEREKGRTDKAEIVDLYQRALQGQLKLAGMGYDYAFERNPLLKIDSTRFSADQSARLIADKLV